MVEEWRINELRIRYNMRGMEIGIGSFEGIHFSERERSGNINIIWKRFFGNVDGGLVDISIGSGGLMSNSIQKRDINSSWSHPVSLKRNDSFESGL